MAGSSLEDCLADTQFSEVDATKDKCIHQTFGIGYAWQKVNSQLDDPSAGFDMSCGTAFPTNRNNFYL